MCSTSKHYCKWRDGNSNVIDQCRSSRCFYSPENQLCYQQFDIIKLNPETNIDYNAITRPRLRHRSDGASDHSTSPSFSSELWLVNVDFSSRHRARHNPGVEITNVFNNLSYCIHTPRPNPARDSKQRNMNQHRYCYSLENSSAKTRPAVIERRRDMFSEGLQAKAVPRDRRIHFHDSVRWQEGLWGHRNNRKVHFNEEARIYFWGQEGTYSRIERLK